MRKLIIVAAAIAAASCGGNQGNLSNQEAQDVASTISDALTAANQPSNDRSAARVRELLAFTSGVHVSKACAGGGDLKVDGSLSVSCPTFFSCTFAGSLMVAAEACTTGTGVTINGTLAAAVSGTGFPVTTVSGTLTVSRPGEPDATCAVNVKLTLGSRIGGSICGVTLR